MAKRNFQHHYTSLQCHMHYSNMLICSSRNVIVINNNNAAFSFSALFAK